MKVNTLSYKTISANKTTVEKKWWIVDAENETLGRLASKVAIIARGKHKASFTPHVDCGDHIIVVNVDKVRLSGNKMMTKEYITFSGYPGGQKTAIAKDLIKTNAVYMMERAVKGMLPRNRLGRALFSNVHIVEGTEHNHEAQKPQTLNLNDIR